MCDTFVALGSATTDGSVILGKNSDREPNEAHQILCVPRAEHAPGDRVQCTYLALPQVRETHAILLGKPFWMWGCEMGANEHGVAIGNEAVFTREPYAKTGLTGMDLQRLALERADSAERALEIITALIAEYGQGGACGYLHKGFYYHNSFCIADRQEAWVLETAGKHWAAERVSDVRSISNKLTIGETWDLASPRLADHARMKGWCRRGQTFSFARCYSDLVYSHFSRAHDRQASTSALLRERIGRLDALSAMDILRHHGNDDDPAFAPATSTMRSVCMHAGNELVRSSQSVGSLVARLNSDGDTLWMTGTSAPCTSVFKPLYMDASGMPDFGVAPAATYDANSLWWRHERLHRALLRDYDQTLGYAQERDALQERLITQEHTLRTAESHPASARSALTQKAFDSAADLTEDWAQRLLASPAKPKHHLIYDRYWAKQNRLAGMPTP